MGFILFDDSDYLLQFKKGQSFTKKDKERLVDAYFRNKNLAAKKSIQNLGIKLSEKKYSHQNFTFIQRLISMDNFQELKFFLSLKPSLPSKYSFPVFRNIRIFNLFKKYLKSQNKELKFYLNDPLSVVSLFSSRPFVLKHIEFDYTKAFLSFLQLSRPNHEIDPLTYKIIKKNVDVPKLELNFPMLSFFMSSGKQLDHLHAKALSIIFRQGNLNNPRLTDFLGKTFGIKNSKITKKFSASNKKSYLAVYGSFLKKAFVDANKANYAIDLLNLPLNDRIVNLMIYFPETFNSMIAVLTPEQFKTLLTEMVTSKRFISSDFHTIRDSIDLFSSSKLFIDTKFSNINTVTKFAKYLNTRTMKQKNPIRDIPLHIPLIDGEILPNNLELILPKTNHDLIDWGIELRNCLGSNSYDLAIMDGACCIIGVKKDGKLTYCLEVAFGDITAALGNMNSKINRDDYSLIKEYLKPILVPFKNTPFPEMKIK